MRKKIAGCMVVVTFGALLAGGCAKKEVVKGEEPITAAQPAAPSAAPEVATPQREEAKPAPAPAEAAPITGESKVSEEAPKGGAAAGELAEGLQKIYFNFDSAELSEESRTALSKNAEFLGKQSSLKVRIEGNCDERGSDEYNMALGERRAQAAKNYLVNLGVQRDRISVISYGEEKPADPGHDEAAWAKNRRDEFVIVK